MSRARSFTFARFRELEDQSDDRPAPRAGITAVAVTLPSFTALVPHLGTAQVDLGLAAILVVTGAVGSFVGARLTSRYVSGPALKRMFGILIVVMTLVKLITLVGA